MSRNERLICLVVLFLLLLVGVGLLYTFRIADQRVANGVKELAFIAEYASDPFSLGLEKATLEHNADVHRTSLVDNTPQQLVGAVQREIDNGIDAIILLGFDEKMLGALSRSSRFQVPIVSVQTELTGYRPSVSILPDDEALCTLIVSAMAEEYADRPAPVYLLEDSQDSSRFRLAQSALAASGIPYEIVEARELPYIAMGSIVLAITENGMESLLEHTGKTCRLFGIGYSAECLYQCANGRIEAIALWGDYAAAYTAVVAAIASAEGEPTANVTLESYLVTADSMYEDPLSQILFPIS